MARLTLLLALVPLVACAEPRPAGAPTAPSPHAAPEPSRMTTFAQDAAYLEKHAPLVVLAGANGARVAVSPAYQGRVMTSAVAEDAASLGFVHRKFIDAGKTGTAFDNYGGEDRFWLGPEGGQFGLYFAPGAPYAFDAWQTPHEMQEGAWDVVARDAASVTMGKTMRVTNHGGARFTVSVRRAVRLLSAPDVRARLDAPVDPSVAWVAYESDNRVTNAGDAAWTDDRGLLSIWILGMFAPASDARIVIPFDADAGGPIVNDKYFGAIPAERLAVHEHEGYLVLTADGQQRGKIGLGAARAKAVAASYSPSQNLLTIVQYDKPKGETKYVNSMWEEQKAPYGGDVVNAYNDGPTAPGKPSLGGFYELETSSPALALAPGATASHAHRTFHFVGARAALDPIAKKVLGVGLDAIAP